METTVSSEMLVNFYQTTWCHIPSYPIPSCYCQVLLFIVIQEAIQYGLITCALLRYTQSPSLLYGFVTAYIQTIPNRQVYRHIHKIVKSDYQLCHIGPYGTWLPLDRFSCHSMSSSQISVQKIQVWIKSDKSRYFTWRPMYICDNILLNSS